MPSVGIPTAIPARIRHVLLLLRVSILLLWWGRWRSRLWVSINLVQPGLRMYWISIICLLHLLLLLVVV